MMSIALYDGRVVRWSLALQLVALAVFCIVFAAKDVKWGGSALLGGLSAWLSSVFFMIFIRYRCVYTPPEGRISWFLALSEVVKITSMIVLLMISLRWFNAVFLPLFLTYLAVWMIHILISAMIGYRVNFN